MGIIRGKIESEIELRPRMIYVGDCPAYLAEDGNWYDRETGEKCEVMSLEEALAKGTELE